MQRPRVAERRDAGEAELAGLAQFIAGGHDFAEYALGVEAVAAGHLGDAVVQLEQIDMVAAEPLQAGIERRRDRRADAAIVGFRDAHLGAEVELRLQLGQDAAEVGLGSAVAIEGGGIEVGDAQFEGAGDGPLLVGRIALGHQAADGAATEGKDGDLHAGLAEFALLHGRSPLVDHAT